MAEEKRLLRQAVIDSAGKSNPKVDAMMKASGIIGKALIPVSIGFAVYNIAVAENKALEAGRQLTGFAGGAAGGYGGAMAGAVAAGLVCGPGALICMSVITVVGLIAGGLAGSTIATETYEILLDYDPDDFNSTNEQN